MAKTALSVLFTVTVLLSAAFVTSFSMMDSADALKSKGTKSVKPFGKLTAGKICGDKLCSDKKSTRAQKTQNEPLLDTQ